MNSLFVIFKFILLIILFYYNKICIVHYTILKIQEGVKKPFEEKQFILLLF